MSEQRWVLDAWALLALLQREEPAATRVKELIQAMQEDDTIEVFVSVINLGEVYYWIGRMRSVEEADETVDGLIRLGLSVLGATDKRVFAAAAQKIDHRISYADAFAVSATLETSGTLVTGDPELIQLGGVLPIRALSRERR